MPNGYQGSVERWRELVAPLAATDEVIERFASEHGMRTEKDSHSWPSRHLTWFAQLDRSIEIYLNPDLETYRIGISSSRDTGSGRYWRADVIADVSRTQLPKEMPGLLEKAFRAVSRWKAEDLRFVGEVG